MSAVKGRPERRSSFLGEVVAQRPEGRPLRAVTGRAREKLQ